MFTSSHTCPSTAFTGDAPIGKCGSLSYEVIAFFLGCYALEALCVPSESGVCFPESGGIPATNPTCFQGHILWGLTSSSFCCQTPKLGSLMWGSQPDNGRNSLVLLFSCLWVTHPADMGFDFIIIEPLLPSFCGFSFVFRVGVSFLWVLESTCL